MVMCRLKKKYEKEFDKNLAKRFKTYTESVAETLINSVWCRKKVFIWMSTWTFARDSLKMEYINLTMENMTTDVD